MICPNCGRELPDTARVCPGCSAVQRVFRRKHADADIPEPAQPARVSRRTAPEQKENDHKRESAGEQRRMAIPAQQRRANEPGARDTAHIPDMPIGLSKQAEREQAQVRRVRRAPNRVRRKVDAKPMMAAPPIYRKSHKRLFRVVFAILLLTLFVSSAGGYMLFNTENGQRMMATWGWSVAETSAYVTLGRELLEQAYFTRALEKLEIAVEREPDNVDALVLIGQAYTEMGRMEDAKEIYERLITDIAPAHPSAYRNLIKIYQQEGYNAEALALMKTASVNANSTQEFDVMLREFTPETPSLSQCTGSASGRYESVSIWTSSATINAE